MASILEYASDDDTGPHAALPPSPRTALPSGQVFLPSSDPFTAAFRLLGEKKTL